MNPKSQAKIIQLLDFNLTIPGLQLPTPSWGMKLRRIFSMGGKVCKRITKKVIFEK